MAPAHGVEAEGFGVQGSWRIQKGGGSRSPRQAQSGRPCAQGEHPSPPVISSLLAPKETTTLGVCSLRSIYTAFLWL